MSELQVQVRGTEAGLTRLVLTVVVIFSILLIATVGLFIFGISSNRQSVITTGAGATVRSINDFGSQISLQQARDYIRVSTLGLPSFLPNNLSLYQIRGQPELVALVYQSPSLLAVAGYNTGSLIILILNDSTSYYFPSGPVVVKSAIPSCSSNANGSVTCNTITYEETISEQALTQLSVSGHAGWGITYEGTTLSFLTWWSGGIHYSATANLPLTVLVNIAESMNT